MISTHGSREFPNSAELQAWRDELIATIGTQLAEHWAGQLHPKPVKHHQASTCRAIYWAWRLFCYPDRPLTAFHALTWSRFEPIHPRWRVPGAEPFKDHVLEQKAGEVKLGEVVEPEWFI